MHSHEVTLTIGSKGKASPDIIMGQFGKIFQDLPL
jgi:hypothetical protein